MSEVAEEQPGWDGPGEVSWSFARFSRDLGLSPEGRRRF